tara:strand:+ start:983 stop:1141 length:159 start_codon:yes stop_codon:yes gene_type:complete
MKNRIRINQLLEEAQANLTLYQNGQDDRAIERYVSIMESVEFLRESNLGNTY